MLPIGEYHYCWSPVINDLYRKTLICFDDKDAVDKVLADGKYSEDRNLAAAVASGHEVMIHCQKAILIREDIATAMYHSITASPK